MSDKDIPNIKVNEVVHYLAYLIYREGVEPSVSNTSKECAIAYNKLCGSIDDVLLTGCQHHYLGRNEAINDFFNTNRRYIYALATDIVEREYNGLWIELIYLVIDDISHRYKKYELTRYYRENSAWGDINLTLWDFMSLIEGKVVNDSHFVLEVKANLIKIIADNLKHSFHDMHGFHYYEVITTVFAENHERPFPKVDIAYL